jgi:dipeptidase E
MIAPRALLLSSSRVPGRDEYLTWAADDLRDFLGPVKRATFVPFAGVTIAWPEYAARTAEALGTLGVTIEPVLDEASAAGRLRGAEAIVVGGGNTFHLLHLLQRSGALEAIGERVRAGVPYVGWSAGSNIACPTIRTTNDMPIVEPRSLGALGLVPFQLNPHFTDWQQPGHRGETRTDRLNEYITVNRDVTVVGLREGGILRLEGDRLTLGGIPDDAILFRQGAETRAVQKGADLSFLLRES